jgi:tetratricopeptide (TPR) repeat protein
MKRHYLGSPFQQRCIAIPKSYDIQDKDSMKVYLDRSAVTFEHAVRLQPDSASTYKNLAFVYMNAQRFDDAIPALEKLIEKDNSVDGYKFLGEIHYNQGTILRNQYQTTKNAEDSVKAQVHFNNAVKVLEEGRKTVSRMIRKFFLLFLTAI